VSKTQTSSTSDAQLPDDSRFDATSDPLPVRGSLHGTDRQFVRQFLQNFNGSLIDAYDPIVPYKITRSSSGEELRIRLEDSATTVGYNRIRRATRGTGYEIADMRVLACGTISLAFSHSNE